MFYRILLICFLICFSINVSFAKDDYLLVSEGISDSQFDNELSDDQYDNSDYKNSQNNNYHERRPLLLSDSVFSPKKNITLGGLIFRISSVVLLLLGILFAVKFYLARANLIPQGGFLEELTQKLTNNFSTFAPNLVKLKQSLILTPGQNIYLVEIEGKKLLLGGTHQGGVQFLADLSDKISQIEESQNHFNSNNNNVTYEIKNDVNI